MLKSRDESGFIRDRSGKLKLRLRKPDPGVPENVRYWDKFGFSSKYLDKTWHRTTPVVWIVVEVSGRNGKISQLVRVVVSEQLCKVRDNKCLLDDS